VAFTISTSQFAFYSIATSLGLAYIILHGGYAPSGFSGHGKGGVLRAWAWARGYGYTGTGTGKTPRTRYRTRRAGPGTGTECKITDTGRVRGLLYPHSSNVDYLLCVLVGLDIAFNPFMNLHLAD
jgi:hypothetical protein